MLRKVNGRWCIISKTTRRPLAYFKGKGKPSPEWVAVQEARIKHFKEDIDQNTVDIKQMYVIFETVDILNNLGYNIKLNEVVGVAGYRPVGIHEFFQFMSRKDIPNEDKTTVKNLSVAHAKDPTAGHNVKIGEMFAKHGIDLSGVVPVATRTVTKEAKNIKSDILPVSGAGQDGTDTLVNKYLQDTPFQKIKKILKR